MKNKQTAITASCTAAEKALIMKAHRKSAKGQSYKNGRQYSFSQHIIEILTRSARQKLRKG